MRWLIVMALVACASKNTGPTNGSGTGSGSGSGIVEKPPVDIGKGSATTCDELRPRLELLYRGEAEVTEPKRVAEAVADNTAMVLADCAKDPAKVVACVNAAVTVAEVESKCVRPLDDEGSEGMELRK